MKISRSDFTRREWQLVKTLTTPAKVQRFLSQIPYNRETEGATCHSFRGVLKNNRAHCLEAALVAATVLEQHGYPPLLVSIESQDLLDHVLFLYRKRGRYGSVARSRDVGLHGRKPVFRSVRDLVMTYFDPYIDKTGRITGYGVVDLNELGGYDWRFSERNVWRVERLLQELPHTKIVSSDRRYQKWRARYLAFHQLHPDRSPDYFPTRSLWQM